MPNFTPPPVPSPCTSYLPGHGTHWGTALQLVRRSCNGEATDDETETGRIVAINGVRVAVQFEDRPAEVGYFVHDPDWLRYWLPRRALVVWDQRSSLLTATARSTHISAKPETTGPPTPCLYDGAVDRTPEGLARYGRRHGGWSVRVQDLCERP